MIQILTLIARASMLGIWLIAGLYMGAGGITRIENDNFLKQIEVEKDTIKVNYHELVFENKAALIHHLEDGQMKLLFPWIDNMPSYSSYILTACSFGLLGALIRIFIQLAIENKTIAECKIMSMPILGLLTGLVMLGVSLIFPAVLSTTETTIKPSGLMFICLFGGLFATGLYEKMNTMFSDMFSKSVVNKAHKVEGSSLLEQDANTH